MPFSRYEYCSVLIMLAVHVAHYYVQAYDVLMY